MRRLDRLRALDVNAVLVGPAYGKDIRDHLENGFRWGALRLLDEATVRSRAEQCTPAVMRRRGYYPPEEMAELEALLEQGWHPQVERDPRNELQDKLRATGWRVNIGRSGR